MNYDEIKIAQDIRDEAEKKWIQALSEYWKNTPPCSNTKCRYYGADFVTHCHCFDIVEDCEDYTFIPNKKGE